MRIVKYNIMINEVSIRLKRYILVNIDKNPIIEGMYHEDLLPIGVHMIGKVTLT